MNNTKSVTLTCIFYSTHLLWNSYQLTYISMNHMMFTIHILSLGFTFSGTKNIQGILCKSRAMDTNSGEADMSRNVRGDWWKIHRRAEVWHSNSTALSKLFIYVSYTTSLHPIQFHCTGMA